MAASAADNVFRLTDELKKDLTCKVCLEACEVGKDAASSLGLLFKDPQVPDAFNPVPITLLPSIVSSHALHEILQLQSDISLVQHRVAHDREFLTSALAATAAVDPFIRNLMNIYQQVDIDSQIELEFVRSDYLLHCDDPNLSFRDALNVGTYKQVEVNMICIAFAGLSSKMHTVHNRILNFLDCDIVENPQDGDVLPQETRLLVEKTVAIKCPSVAHQLSGFKKIQQELSKPEVLARFVPEESVRARMLDTCVGQWDVSLPNSAEAIERALKHPEKYVLKPNREGGGNNFFNEELVSKMQEIRGTETAQEFILMERIEPPLQENILVRSKLPPALVQTISEVGTFGAFIARNKEIIFNASARDVLIRSKASNVNEGGVSTGYAC
ncbi:glutathione synthetase-like [Paramacrobiotus metropolitanus]|uniref:glutathione synthetase-like n=1 Tax=Paramacrobiotus metropolitanus TaxID=2943436 RepID=UPI0024461BBF|nr:glutathione synthetase-like [Paramacrobiotus metropolitanus]